jgi:hypothetical protein
VLVDSNTHNQSDSLPQKVSPTLLQADSRKLAARLFTDGEELGQIRDEESRQR